VTLDTLARLARAEGRYGEARVQYADVLERRRRTLGEDNLSVLESGEGLALTDFLDGQREASAARLGQVLEARRRRQGTGIPAALQTLADQAMALEATGSFSAAEPLAREALAGERAVRPEHWRRFFAQSVLGAALWGQKRYAEAAPLLREGVAGLEARREQVGVPDRFRVERARAWLARLR
jgi:eukaryotic-like serine/threonine-protein kinase